MGLKIMKNVCQIKIQHMNNFKPSLNLKLYKSFFFC